MNNKIELDNPIDTRVTKIGIMISFIVVIVYLIYQFLVRALSWVDVPISIFGFILVFFVFTHRQLFVKPKSIEIDGDHLVLHYRFKSKPVTMNLEDIGSIDVSVDGTKINDWIGFDGILTFKTKTPVEFFDLYWKSAIAIREHYKSRFGEYPPMREGFVKKRL